MLRQHYHTISVFIQVYIHRIRQLCFSRAHAIVSLSLRLIRPILAKYRTRGLCIMLISTSRTHLSSCFIYKCNVLVTIHCRITVKVSKLFVMQVKQHICLYRCCSIHGSFRHGLRCYQCSRQSLVRTASRTQDLFADHRSTTRYDTNE
jgi:hypothetical protein